ncbi:hypothetical protein [Flavobacterium sp. CAU 1735]|uniref:hypothetical protein n=1 Tax=Flavobacterium sp. CAU 1735 TaxID=3140361 RepID=UPI0032604657
MMKFKLLVSFLSFLSLTCFSQGVGINIQTPQATLDVNGNLRLETAPIASDSDTVSSLILDNTTKEVKMIQSRTGNNSPINYIIYHLNNVNSDWVNNFDTKISTIDYAVVVVGSAFNLSLLVMGRRRGKYNPFTVYAFEEGGTWRIKADYFGGHADGDVNGNWTINCLIISRSMLKIVPSVTTDIKGSNTGSAATAPAGL